MAMNPMKRRSRNSFLIGFLVALVIMAVVIMLILYKMQEVKKKYDDIVAKQQTVYVASKYLTSGTEVDISSFKTEVVQTSLSKNDFIQPSDFEIVNDDGTVVQKLVVVRTDIPSGTIITKDLLEEVEDKTTNDQRLQEYNMIVLPTQLEADQYIDIRLQFPTGEDYIVVSKKKVVETDATTVWLKMYEDEILMLSNAIVEAYTVQGTKLYATTYTQAGMQNAATPNYVVSRDVMSIIEKDPNIVQEARNSLYKRYEDLEQVKVRERINNMMSVYKDSQDASVETRVQEEITKRQEARQEYVGGLGGTN